MARNNFTFSTSLKLNSKDFQKGVAQVTRTLNGLKSSFMSFAGALGAGLGFTQLTRSIMDTATKLSIAQNTLKNVSNEVGEYGENMIWLRKISEKYGQDLVSLTNNFAQFRAAANDTSLSVDELRKVYESLTRAAGAYHMSASRVDDMMNAVTQMFSKGKIASEELRRQLGNALPGAFNLMAKAAGMSTAELEKAMKAGKITAEDVLPKFAKILNEATSAADFNSLQSSLNRLKNSWTDLVEKGDFEGTFKRLVDSATKALTKIGDNINNLKKLIISALAGIGSYKITKGWTNEIKNFTTALNADINKTSDRLNKMGSALRKTIQFNNNTIGGQYYHGVKHKDGTRTVFDVKPKILPKDISLLSDKDLEAIKAYNKELLRYNDLWKQKTGQPFISQQQMQKINKFFADIDEQTNTVTSRLDKANRSLGFWGKTWTKVTGLVKNFGMVLKSAFSSLAIGAVIAAVSFLIQKLVEAGREAKRLKNYATDAIKEINDIANTPSDEITNLTMLRDALKQSNGELAKTQGFINKVNEALGLSGEKAFTVESSYEAILNACDNWLKDLNLIARKEAAIAKIKAEYSKQIQLQAENELLMANPNYGKTKTRTNYEVGYVDSYEVLTPEARKIQKTIDKNNKELDAVKKAIDAILSLRENPEDENNIGPYKTLLSPSDLISNRKGNNAGGGGNDSGTKGKTPTSVLQDFVKSRTELENQYKNGALSQDKYVEELIDLEATTYKSIAAFGLFDDVIKNLSSDLSYVAEDLRSRFGFFDEIDASIAAQDEALKKQMEDEISQYFEDFKSWLDIQSQEIPKKGIRKTDFDYMFSDEKKGLFSERDREILSQEIEINEDSINRLESFISSLEEVLKNMGNNEFSDSLRQFIRALKQQADSEKKNTTKMQHKLNFAEAEAELEALQTKVTELRFDAFKSLSSDMQNLTNSFVSILEIFNEDIQDSNFYKGLTRTISIFNSFVQVMETVSSVISTVRKAQELLANMKSATSAKIVAANAAEMASEYGVATAAKDAAISKTASIMSLLGPVGVAAGIGVVVAAILAGLSKFSKGGVVGGNSTTGDKVLARVNSGEGILTAKGLQNLGTLYNNQTGGGNVQFKIHGSDLVGVLNNYNSKMRG